MVKLKTFGKDLRLLVVESFKNGLSTKKIFENVQKLWFCCTIGVFVDGLLDAHGDGVGCRS
jgi:hypothetical protein